MRVTRTWVWWITAAVLLLAPVAWYLGSPLFINRTVVEQTPPAAAGADLARGTFVDADAVHKGSGVALIRKAGADLIVRLEDFRVTNGPDLYLYLAAHPSPASRGDVDGGFVSLGRLKGNIGAQNYQIPPGTDLVRYRSVVVYCQRFHVVFATATLQQLQ